MRDFYLPEDSSRQEDDFFAWCNGYGSGITAIATVALTEVTAVLVVVTYFYLIETQEQRKILHRQFILSNSPDIFINPPTNFSYDTSTAPRASIQNSGSQVKEIKVDFSLICCVQIGSMIEHLDSVKIWKASTHIPRLGNGKITQVFLNIPVDEIKLLENAAKDVTRDLVYARVLVEYEKPTFSDKGEFEQVTDIASFSWRPRDKSWAAIPREQYKTIIEVVNALKTSPK
jgi:hypothetical protein